MLFDNHGRVVNYLRLAVTDRCNLRCFYCMPEEGIEYVARKELLTYEEMIRIVSIFAHYGISKVRITGGEPFLRKGMLPFLYKVSSIKGIDELNITTNGTLTSGLVPDLKKMGVRSVNLSLDSLDRDRFFEITRRDELDKVLKTLDQLLAHQIPTKINAVVMDGKNDEDILPMVALTKDAPISVRFIEEMPFNGTGAQAQQALRWHFRAIIEHIESRYQLTKLKDAPNSTSLNYQIKGFKGTIGVIPAFSRTFCGTCNRIRLTPQGVLKTCLYGDGVFNIKNLMRAGATDDQLGVALTEALGNRAKDGFEAESRRAFGRPSQDSMATIGG